MRMPTDPAERAAWKFLWQFPDFDLRQKEKDKPPPAAVLEKRVLRTEAEIQSEVDDKTPVDLRVINIEDLIIRANTAPKRDFNFEVRPEKNQSDEENKGSALFSKAASGVFALIALSAMAVIGVKEIRNIRTGQNKNVGEVPLGKADLSLPLANQTPRKSALPQKRGPGEENVVVPAAPPSPQADRKVSTDSPPTARDRGEIREEEILRAREEERRRELDERERRAREEEEDRKREDDDNDESPRKKRRKDRSVAEDEIENGSTNDSNSETTVVEPEPSVLED
jgi:hypothetical protein